MGKYTLHVGGGTSSGGGGHHSLFGKIIGGIAGGITNLANDTKAAVEGIPTGLVMTAEHPIRAAKTIARATWHDWAPLVEGHPIEWAKQTYDHPLAPLLDVATVFSAGAAGAARMGAALDAAGAEGGLASKLADLGKPSYRMVPDVAGRAKDAEEAAAKAERGSKAFPNGRPVGNHADIAAGQDYGVRAPIKATASESTHEGAPLMKTYSASPGANLRRALANRAMMHLEPHLPNWFSQGARDSRVYGRLQHVEDAHKLAASGAQIKTFMAAGKVLDDPENAKVITPAIMAHNYANFVTHASEKDATKGLAAGERYILAGRHAEAKFSFDPKRPDLAQRMDTFGNEFTTKDVAQAQMRNGKALTIRTDAAKAVATEGGNSTRFLRKLARNPTLLWKRVQVGYAPRVITNNTVGNHFMYMMRTAGDGGSRGLIDAVKYAHGQKAAMNAFKDMHAHVLSEQGSEAAGKFTALAHPALYNHATFENGKLVPAVDSDARIRAAFGDRAADAVKKNPDWISQHYKQEVNDGLHNVLEDDATTGSKVRQHLRSGLYPLVHRISDQPIRIASLYQFMRQSPEVRAFLKTHPGTNLDEAISKSLAHDKTGAALRERGAQHVRKIAGDYTTTSPTEKLIQNIMPFYLWDKHVLKHFGNMVSEKPGRIALMQKTSQMGDAETQKLLGDLPDFMKGAMPLSLLGLQGRDGRSPILAPSGLNPYSTVGDLARLGSSLTTDPSATHAADAAGELSPALTGLIEQITGKKIGTEAPVSRKGGIIPSTLAGMFGGTSYGKLAQQLIEGSQNTGKTTAPTKTHPFGTETPLLYEKNPSTTALGLLGLPIKEASMVRAQQMADQESGKKKRKKATASSPFGS